MILKEDIFFRKMFIVTEYAALSIEVKEGSDQPEDHKVLKRSPYIESKQYG